MSRVNVETLKNTIQNRKINSLGVVQRELDIRLQAQAEGGQEQVTTRQPIEFQSLAKKIGAVERQGMVVSPSPYTPHR